MVSVSCCVDGCGRQVEVRPGVYEACADCGMKVSKIKVMCVKHQKMFWEKTLVETFEEM